jgi:putative transcription antitermination factor YqgF
MFDTIAIDWGSVRVGLAIASMQTGLTLPYQKECPNQKFFEILEEEINSRKIKFLVIGIPTNFYFEPTETTQKIQEVIKIIQNKFENIEVITVNERNTTQSVQQLNQSFGQKMTKSQINHQSACNIFELYYLQRNAKN